MTERRRGQRKDRLIQTRVPQDLECTLKDEARRRRLSVSHLIRNVLEDTFNLVDNVVVEVDRVVADSRHMAQTLKRDAERIRATARGDNKDKRERADLPSEGGSGPEGESSLSHVYAWQSVVLNQQAQCARCATTIGKGAKGHLGLCDQLQQRTWLCSDCLVGLQQSDTTSSA